MARTLLTATVCTTSGIGTFSGFDAAGDVVNGNEFDNDGNIMLQVRNADGGATHNIVFGIPVVIDGTAVPSVAIAISASTQRWFGPFRTALYNQANGRVTADVDSAQLFLKVVRIPEVS